MQPLYFTTFAIAVFLAVIHPRLSTAIDHPCLTPCQNAEECNAYANCKYGDFKDNCGRKICYKGPDEPCSDYGRGKCYPSLQCSNCGFCKGCYIGETVECANHECLYVPAKYKAHFANN